MLDAKVARGFTKQKFLNNIFHRWVSAIQRNQHQQGKAIVGGIVAILP